MPRHRSTHATQTGPAGRHRRVLVLADGPFPADGDGRAARIARIARGATVLVVAPALAAPGERWIIDDDAREAQARARLESWIRALADRAGSVRGEIGDEHPRTAVADALAGFAADEVVEGAGAADGPAERRDRAARRRDRLGSPRGLAVRAGLT